ncbi:MAG: hypothetical protein JF588_21985 [Caulobacterales bacterium]|nr:hypothetical protein [Caulobacterales bacterium]
MQRVAIGGLFAIMFAQALYLCWARGIWIDEIWSLWLGRRDLPFAQVVTERWTHDVHPPLFSAINWLFDPAVGLNIVLRRLLNLLPLAAFIGGAAYVARRDRALGKIVLVFAVLLTTNAFYFVNFAEHRPYFLMENGYALALLSLYAIAISPGDFERRRDLPLALLSAAAIFVALNSHFVCAFIEAPSIGLVLLDQLRRRRWGWSAWIAGAVAIAVLTLLLTFYLQYAYVGPTAKNLWIDTGMRKGLQIIARAVAYCAVGNVVAAAVAMLVLWRIGRTSEPAADGARPPAGSLTFILALGLGVVAAAIAMVAINAVKPIIEYRYFAPFAPASALILAVLAAPRILSSRWLLMAFLLNGLLLGAWATHREAKNLRWDATARYIQAEVRKCPTTRVYGVDPRYVQPYTGAEGHDRVQAWGYQIVGRAFGFEAQPIHMDAPAAILTDDRCPTLFWAEHMFERDAVRQVMAAPFGPMLPPGVSLKSAKVFRGPSGFVIRLPAMPLTPG